MFAYEVQAGVQIERGLIATADIDLLYDARRHISLAVSGLSSEGLIGLLKKVDGSFVPARPRGFRAVNRDGYLVDLIRPEAKDVFRDRLPTALSDVPDDLEGAAIFGLAWLINSPRLEAVALDERGYPARLVAIDPRAFALHKAWLSRREDREPTKAARDLDQAKAAASIATRYSSKSFEARPLGASKRSQSPCAGPYGCGSIRINASRLVNGSAEHNLHSRRDKSVCTRPHFAVSVRRAQICTRCFGEHWGSNAWRSGEQYGLLYPGDGLARRTDGFRICTP